MQYEEIGNRIKYLRKMNHYTREALAEKIDISSKFLYEIEKGKKGFSADILSRLSKAFSVSCDFILFGEDIENKGTDKVVGVLSQFDNGQIGQIVDIIQRIYDLSAK